MGGTPAQPRSASQTPPWRWGWPPPTLQAREEGPGVADSSPARRAKQTVGRNPRQPCWALGVPGQLGGEGCGLQGGICTPISGSSQRVPSRLGPSPPQSLLHSHLGCQGATGPGSTRERQGAGVQTRSVGWVLLGDSRWRRDSQVLPRPNQPHGKSAGRTFLAIPRGELVWKVLLEMKPR